MKRLRHTSVRASLICLMLLFQQAQGMCKRSHLQRTTQCKHLTYASALTLLSGTTLYCGILVGKHHGHSLSEISLIFASGSSAYAALSNFVHVLQDCLCGGQCDPNSDIGNQRYRTASDIALVPQNQPTEPFYDVPLDDE